MKILVGNALIALVFTVQKKHHTEHTEKAQRPRRIKVSRLAVGSIFCRVSRCYVLKKKAHHAR